MLKIVLLLATTALGTGEEPTSPQPPPPPPSPPTPPPPPPPVITCTDDPFAQTNNDDMEDALTAHGCSVGSSSFPAAREDGVPVCVLVYYRDPDDLEANGMTDTPVCLTSFSWFKSRVDDLSDLELVTTFTQIANTTQDASVKVVVGGSESDARNFALEGGVVNDLTVVVGLDKGNVIGVDYQTQNCYSALEDRPCSIGSTSLDDGYCDEFDNCVIPFATCEEAQYAVEWPDGTILYGADCDLSYIVAWSGTDKNSVPMQTGSQISGINKWSVSSLAGDVADSVTELDVSEVTGK